MCSECCDFSETVFQETLDGNFFSKAGGAACHDAFIVKDDVRHGEDQAVVPIC